MRYIKQLLIAVGLLFALSCAAEECPYLLPNQLYKCTHLVMDNRKATLKAFMTLLNTADEPSTIIIDGIGEDHDLDFTITLIDDWQKVSIDGQVHYITPDTDDNNVILTDWTNGSKIIFFKYSSETLGVAFTPTPFFY